MPWSIHKRDGKYCVVKDSDGTVVHCHETKAKAEAQQAVLYASEKQANVGLGHFEQMRESDGRFGGSDGSSDKSESESNNGWDGHGVAPSLDAFAQHWESQGVQTEVYQKSSGDKPIVLSKVIVPKDQRGGGTGSKFMDGLTKYADAHGLAIHLTPSKDYGGSVPRLVGFYKEHGFVENKGRNKDYEVSEAMYRPAQGITAGGTMNRYYMTDQHPERLGQWVVALAASGEILAAFGEGPRAEHAALQALVTNEADLVASLVAAAEADGIEWEADPGIAYEGTPTGDHRLLAAGGGTWRALPQPVMLKTRTSLGHEGAMFAGAITQIERRDGGVIYAAGRYESGETGQEAKRLVDEGLRGVSIDITGSKIETEFSGEDEQGFPTDYMDHFTEYEVGGMTITPFPAFADAKIRNVVRDNQSQPALPVAVAASASTAPPVEWFQVAEPDEPTAFTVLPNGQAFGHLAAWGTCHIGREDTCVTPPHSATDYAFFHTGVVRCEDGCEIPVGQMTLGTGHAGLGLNQRSAAAHYDHTGTAAVDLHVVDGVHGPWACGALRPGLSDDQRVALQAAAPSGDWRRINGNLEMVAVLAVNVPGFPVPRPRTLTESGGVTAALVAAVAPRATEGVRTTSLERRLAALEAMVLPSMLEDADRRMFAARAAHLDARMFEQLRQEGGRFGGSDGSAKDEGGSGTGMADGQKALGDLSTKIAGAGSVEEVRSALETASSKMSDASDKAEMADHGNDADRLSQASNVLDPGQIRGDSVTTAVSQAQALVAEAKGVLDDKNPPPYEY